MPMRITVCLIFGVLAGCASTVTVPSDSVLMEVPQGGVASTTGGAFSTAPGDDFTRTIENALAESPASPTGTPASPAVGAMDPAAPVALQGSATGTGAALDDDSINLMQWTLEQQRIDAAIAERELLDARSKLVVVQPGPLPNRVEGVNIALFAQQTDNAVGEARYGRSVGARVAGVGNCGRFRDADAAQRAFLAGGGPERDRYGVDPDGDGFACRWDPAPYRALR
jgi:hypothetical protein